MTKRPFIISAIGVLALAGSFVCFPVFADTKNPVKIDIVEMSDDGTGNLTPWQDITNAMPGMTYSAVPRVKNNGSVPASVKICLSESGIDAIGNMIELDDGTFVIDINDSYWTKDSGTNTSGTISSPIAVCYKYNTELSAGTATEPLFYKVNLSGDLKNEHKNATFNLHLYAEAAENSIPTPNNPDTGVNTISEPLTTAGYISLSLGAAILIGLTLYLLQKSFRKNKA